VDSEMSGNDLDRIACSFHNVAAASAVNVDVDEPGHQRFLLKVERLKLSFVKGHVETPADIENLLSLNQHHALRNDRVWSDDFLRKNGDFRHGY
jgi:hypothetical protein